MKEGVVEDCDLVTVASQGWQAGGEITAANRIRIVFCTEYKHADWVVNL